MNQFFCLFTRMKHASVGNFVKGERARTRFTEGWRIYFGNVCSSLIHSLYRCTHNETLKFTLVSGRFVENAKNNNIHNAILKRSFSVCGPHYFFLLYRIVALLPLFLNSHIFLFIEELCSSVFHKEI
jgi:hypothetical protein